jgi:hypothetical protein
MRLMVSYHIVIKLLGFTPIAGTNTKRWDSGTLEVGLPILVG